MSQEKREVYISYTRRSGSQESVSTFIRNLITAGREHYDLYSIVSKGKNETIKQLKEGESIPESMGDVEIIYDENGLVNGRSIRAFMDELSSADRIIILLSADYFRSRFCMVELLSIYEKQPGNIPVVVFISDYSPDNVKEEALVSFWLQQSKQKLQEKNEDTASLCAKFAAELPCALSWLLGRYDTALEHYVAFRAPLKETDPAVYQVILRELEFDSRSRYAHRGQSEKKVLIHEFVEKVRTSEKFGKYYNVLENDLKVGCFPGLAAYLSELSDKGKLHEVFVNIPVWLKKIADDSPSPSPELKRFAETVKELMGWLLLMAIDERKLNRLVHELNIQNPGHIALCRENDSAFQIIVSSLWACPAFFDLSEGNILRGKRELVLGEKGILKENYEKSVLNDMEFLSIFHPLYDQMSSQNTRHGTWESLKNAMQFDLNSMNDFYLLLEKDWLPSIEREGGLFQEMGKMFPGITLVIPNPETEKTVTTYCIDNLNSGTLYQAIFNTYTQIKRLTHGE